MSDSIQFATYPTSNRVPGVFVEMDPSQANTATVLQRSLLIGQVTAAAATPVSTHPVLIQSADDADFYCGPDSMLAAMAKRYLRIDQFGPLYCLLLKEATAATAAAATITITGSATANGALTIYVGGVRVQSAVIAGDTPTAVAAGFKAAVDQTPGLAATAAVALGVVTMTAIDKGLAGNGLDLTLNYLGAAGGEITPPGLTVVMSAFTGGATNPDLTAALDNLGDQPFDFIGMAYNDAASLDAMEEFLSDADGRWAWNAAIYGHGFSAFKGTLGQATAFGITRNDQHMSVMAYPPSPDPPWIWSAEITARCAVSLRVDPGLPLQYITTTLRAPVLTNRWTIGERNTLLYSGLSTVRVADDNAVIIERMATTYRENAAGVVDNSYLDVETMYGLMFVARDLKTYLLSHYARKKLVSDTTVILAGSNCVNAPLIRASVISEYRALEAGGYVQNSDIFARNVLVQNAGGGLVKILAPVDLVNQLRQIAILLQFLKS